jgi:hypothetical protein
VLPFAICKTGDAAGDESIITLYFSIQPPIEMTENVAVSGNISRLAGGDKLHAPFWLQESTQWRA